jgi:hypothetical protein
MPKVRFSKLIQDSQDFGSTEDHMVSRVFFTLEIGGENLGPFYADLKQVVGGDFAHDEIEVGPPVGYEGTLDHQKFSDAARKYFSMLVGSQGSAVRVGPDARRSNIHIRMRNGQITRSVDFDL